MTTNNTINCAAPETLTDRLIHIETERAVLDAEHRGLMAREDWLTQTTPGIEGAEYKGRGLWVYRGREVHAVPRAQGFDFLAETDKGGRVFEEFDHAFLWLDGVSWGQAIIHGE